MTDPPEKEEDYRYGLEFAYGGDRSKGVEISVNMPRIELALKCAWPHRSAYITWDGFVTPCCHLENPKVLNLGNVLETLFCEIWNGRKYRAFRRKHFDRKSARINCPNYVQAHSKMV